MRACFFILIILPFGVVAQTKLGDTGLNSNIYFTISGGYSQRLGKTPETVQPDYEKYLEGLKKGINVSFSGVYLISENHGLGLQYSIFRTKGRAQNVFLGIGYNGNVNYGSQTDNISISFFGPKYVFIKSISQNERHKLIIEPSAGLLFYKDELTQGLNQYTYSGITLGCVGAFGYLYRISQSFSLGLESSIYLGALSKFNVERNDDRYTQETPGNQKESLSRVDLNLRLLMHF